MLYTIRKHPFAFLHCLSWVGMGACIACSTLCETIGRSEAMFAKACDVLVYVFYVFIILAPFLSLVWKLVRREPQSIKDEKLTLHARAKWFEKNRPGYSLYLLPAALASVLPAAAYLTIAITLPVNYMPAAMCAAIGLSIWLCYICYRWPEIRLLKVQKTANRFRILSGSDPDLFVKLLEQGNVHGIPQKLWEGRQDYLYNMLLRVGAIDERSTITAYRFSAAEAAAQLGVEKEKVSAEEAVWVPLKPLLSLTDYTSYYAIQGLFVYDLEHIAELQYETTDDRLPEEYPCSSREKRLIPDEAALLRSSRRGLRLLSPTAEDDDDNLYQGCMLLMEGAQIAEIKWDPFEDLSPDPAQGYFLNETDKQTFCRLLLEEDAFAYEVCSLSYLEDRKQIAIELRAEPEEISGKRVSNEAKPFVRADGTSYLLLVSCEGFKWHWLHERPFFDR